VIDGSVTVCRRVRGLRKGSEKRSEVLKEGVVRIGVQGSKEVEDRGFRKGLYSRL
jgi:hypothetical protein